MENTLIQLNIPNKEDLKFKSEKGINEKIVRFISKSKKEPKWMLKKRLEGLKKFNKLKLPKWGPNLKELNLQDLHYFTQPNIDKSENWDDLPKEIKETYDKLGIPEAERKSLAGAGAQYESEIIYHNLKKEWKDKGVIFLDMDDAVKEYPRMVQKYFMTSCVPINLHKFSALHAATWSGGTFIYIPKNVEVTIPLQAYFRMNSEKGGQFEHTLIIVDEGASIQYIEGCSAPLYSSNSLHAGCVEIHVLKGGRARYSSIENWSKNTYNLNTKRAIVYENGVMEWINGNMGSKITMLYPATILLGNKSKVDFLGIAFAGKNQHQDTGTKIIHIGKNTSSTIRSKSISQNGGITSYRGLISVGKKAEKALISVECDALMMDDESQTNTYPYMDIHNSSAQVSHEASVGKVDSENIFYLMSRGLSEDEARKMIISGFIKPIIKELPLEYAVEFNKLIELEIEGNLG